VDAAVQPPDAQRPQAISITDRLDSIGENEQQAERPLQLAQDARQGVGRLSMFRLASRCKITSVSLLV